MSANLADVVAASAALRDLAEDALEVELIPQTHQNALERIMAAAEVLRDHGQRVLDDEN